ncbi:MAG: ROK family protein [Anaerolineae bacterium]|nr:ROK family protein [Anaerolineae bacterium]
MTEPLYASMDLGGTKVACAYGTAQGEVVLERTIPTASHEGPLAVLARIADLVNDMAVAVGAAPAAAGMGVPGLADLGQGMTRFLPNLPTQWRDVPVRDVLAPRIGCPVYLLNDVRMATLGELTFGHGRGAPRTMVFLALGTGIGGGIAIEGKLRLGPLGAAGELGHQTVVPDGPLCGCGNRGCVETLASGPAISAQGVWLMASGRAPELHRLVEGDAGRVTPREMAAAAAAGDDAVRDALVRAADYLGISIANLVVALHPDLVVLGGGVAQIGDLLFDTVRATVKRRVRMFPVDGVAIVPSQLGTRAGMLGGLALAAMGGVV